MHWVSSMSVILKTRKLHSRADPHSRHQVHSDVLAATTLAEFQSVEARRHQEILDLIIVKQQDDNQWPFVSTDIFALMSTITETMTSLGKD